VTVHLGHDNGSDRNLAFEGLGLVECGLSNGGIHNEDDQVGAHDTGNLLHFFEKGGFLLVTT
jgi:hypothetical protein